MFINQYTERKNCLRKELIEAGKKYIYQLDGIKEDKIEWQIEKELDEILELDEKDVLEMRQKHFQIGDVNDYKHQWIKTSKGYVLAGIRHINGNVNVSYIYIWPSFKINNLKKVASDIQPFFKIFNPKLLNFWIRPDQNNYKNVEILQQRFYGLVSDLKTYNLELEQPKSYYDWYKGQHDKYIEDHPQFKDRITINPKDLMDFCLGENLLFQKITGNKVGLLRF